MPVFNILILIGIVSVFGVFGLVLAWAEHQTRNIKRADPNSERATQHDDLKMAA